MRFLTILLGIGFLSIYFAQAQERGCQVEIQGYDQQIAVYGPGHRTQGLRLHALRGCSSRMGRPLELSGVEMEIRDGNGTRFRYRRGLVDEEQKIILLENPVEREGKKSTPPFLWIDLKRHEMRCASGYWRKF